MKLILQTYFLKNVCVTFYLNNPITQYLILATFLQDNVQDLLDSRNKMQHCKRLARPEKERLPPRNKRRKREDEEIMLCSSSAEPILTHLTQVTQLPLSADSAYG